MATFSGNAAGYRVDFLDNGEIRVVDIDTSDGDTGEHVIAGNDALTFNDRTYQLSLIHETQHTTDGFVPSITSLADGGYVMVWEQYDYAKNDSLIVTQRYDAAGNAVGAQMQASTADGSSPAITALADGGYVVTWQDDRYADIYARRYDAAGNALGEPTLINSPTSESLEDPVVTGLADGGYIVVWTSTAFYVDDDIYARRFDASGNAVGDNILINTTTTRDEASPVVTALADGGYVIAWHSATHNGNNMDVYFQRFDADGNALGGETLANTMVASSQHDAEILALNDGGFVVAWASANQDGDGYGVYMQRYDAVGNAVGGETRVNTETKNWQHDVAAASLADGGHIVVWTSYAQDGEQGGIFAQRYDAAGNAVGGETQINQLWPEDQGLADVTALDDGGYIVTWVSNIAGGYVTYARRFDANGESTHTESVLLSGTETNDVLNGGAGSQHLLGLGGDDTLSGGDGDDLLMGAAGSDKLSGGAGNDMLYADGDGYPADASPNVLFGDAGDDTLRGDYGDDVLYGGVGNDYISASYGNDTLDGGDGEDYLNGYSGTDTLKGGSGDDFLHGGSGVDTLRGGAGQDTLQGSDGFDVLRGDGGDDIVRGGKHIDQLFGGGGDDRIDGGKGGDTLSGGYGADLFVFSTYMRGGVDTIMDFRASQDDEIWLKQDAFDRIGGVGALGDRFAANADGVAMDANDRILYETDTGNLYYDRDGSGASAKVQFAVVTGVPTLTAADFMVV